MHHGADLTPAVQTGLGWYFLLAVLLNGGAALYVWNTILHGRLAATWGALALFYLVLSAAYFSGVGPPLPQGFRNFVDVLANPVTFTLGIVVLFVVFVRFREFFVRPAVAWACLNGLMLFFGLSMTDWDFRLNVGKPDNVPIAGMIFILGFFTWLGMWKAVRNDRRITDGRPTIEDEDSEKVLVWPDLVYTELICMVVLTVGLVLWAIALKAPLEQPASTVDTPNPSKAPWYFVGLQESLIYFDPWMAGVVLPSLIIFGLMAIPYFDFNQQGSGYYTFDQRKFAIATFMFGFLVLWVMLILIGTFMRGPNQNFFGPYEPWDVHKVEPLNNVNLSEFFWIEVVGTGLPGHWLMREFPGIIAVLLYLFAMPPLLGLTVFRPFLVQMGFIRYMVMVNLLLFMASLPIKMLLRWMFNLKYIVAIQEYFFNI